MRIGQDFDSSNDVINALPDPRAGFYKEGMCMLHNCVKNKLKKAPNCWDLRQPTLYSQYNL